jgi:hypothetical protein
MVFFIFVFFVVERRANFSFSRYVVPTVFTRAYTFSFSENYLMRRKNYSSGTTNFGIVTYNESRHFCSNHKREAVIKKSFFQDGKKLPLAIQLYAPIVKTEIKHANLRVSLAVINRLPDKI